MSRFVDLHTHSHASDGTDSPEELVRLAAQAGLSAIALTDHDTLAGLDEACLAGTRHGISVIRGCELASESPYGEVHFLGLWIPEHAPALESALHGIREERMVRNRQILTKLCEAGMDVSMEEVLAEAGGETIARPHIARVLVAKKYVSSVQDAFASLLGDGGSMFIPRALPSPQEALVLLKNEGAVTVLAHPMLIKAPFSWLEKLVHGLATEGLDALEAWHSDHDAAKVRTVTSMAKRYGLALSGGSDYHGGVKPFIQLGSGKGQLRIPWTVLEALQARRKPA